MLEKSPIKGALKNIRNTVEDILVNDPKAKYFYKDMLAADLERVISISDRYRFIEYKDPDLAELHADNLDWLENMNSHITRTHVNMLKANLEIFDRPKP